MALTDSLTHLCEDSKNNLFKVALKDVMYSSQSSFSFLHLTKRDTGTRQFMMFVRIIFILSVVFAITIAMPMDTTVPPDISFTTLKEDISPEIVATSSVQANEESSERTNVFMNEELELLAMNLPDIFRRDTSNVEGASPIRTAEDTLEESEEEEEESHGTQEIVFPEPIHDEKIEKRDVHPVSFKDTHSPDPNFPKYLNRRKRRISLTKF